MRKLIADWFWLLLFGALVVGFMVGGWSASNQIPSQQQGQRPDAAHSKSEAHPSAISEANTEQGHAQATEKKEPREGFWAWISNFFEVKLTDLLIAVFTVVLALKTSGLFKETAGLREATFKLYDAGERQLEFLKDNSATQSRDTQASIAVARQSAEAAMKAAETAERALVFEHRPWLTWHIQKIRVFRAGRHIRADVDTVFENTGKTPAVAVHYAARLYLPEGGAVINVGMQHLDEMGTEYARGNQLYLTTILPDEKPRALAYGCVIELDNFDPSPTKQFQLYLAIHAGYRLFDGGRIAEVGCLFALKAQVQRQLTPVSPWVNESVDFSFELIDSRQQVPTTAIELPTSRRVT